MRDLHVLSAQLLQELHIVIAGDTKGSTSGHHRHDKSQRFGNLWPTVDQVADEDRFATVRRRHVELVPALLNRIAEMRQQAEQFVQAAVHVADDVERSMLMPQVVPERLTLDDKTFEIFRLLKDVKVPKSFSLQATQRTPHLLRLITDNMRPEIAVGTCAIALLAKLLGEVENEGHGQDVILARQRDQRFS